MKPPKITTEQAWGFDGLMVMAAFRYCLGSRTYIVGACADWLIDIWPMLSENTRSVIRRDLEAEFKRDDDARAYDYEHRPLGWDCDRDDWERVRKLWEKK